MERTMSTCKALAQAAGNAVREGGLRARLRAYSLCAAVTTGVWTLGARARSALRRVADEEGQGTTEYAILVGVLVVIAIFAVAAMRGKVQSLWDAIVSGIDGL